MKPDFEKIAVELTHHALSCLNEEITACKCEGIMEEALRSAYTLGLDHAEKEVNHDRPR